MRDWKGRRYWVVGAADGVGREVALALSRLGVELVVSPAGLRRQDWDRVAALPSHLPGRSVAHPIDPADPRAAEEAVRAHGPLDGLVYLADDRRTTRAQGWDARAAVAMAETNYLGALRCVGAVLPGMIERGQGHIVLAGALAALRGRPGAAGYAASKAAVAALAQSLRADLWRTGVAVQLVTLGLAPTAPPEPAAQAVVEHMNGNGFVVAVPAGRAWRARAARTLPDWAYLRLFAR